jgi:hypothetical protein
VRKSLPLNLNGYSVDHQRRVVSQVVTPELWKDRHSVQGKPLRIVSNANVWQTNHLWEQNKVELAQD